MRAVGGGGGVRACRYRHSGGHFFSGEVNMALALSDIGEGDGATMVIPGGHKSNVNYRSVLDRPDGPGRTLPVSVLCGRLCIETMLWQSSRSPHRVVNAGCDVLRGCLRGCCCRCC
jgi:hypothetical protein